jgi:pre-mRNA-processing factor 6
MNALKANDKDSNLFISIAKVFWVEKKAEKIKKWLKSAVAADKDNGDAWAHLLRFEMEFGSKETENEHIEEFKEADPRHGEVWTTYTKKVENWRVEGEVLLR